MNRTTYSYGGPGFLTLLQIAFIILKLCGVIGWSWVWVLAPIWMSFALCLLLFTVLILEAVAEDARKRR